MHEPIGVAEKLNIMAKKKKKEKKKGNADAGRTIQMLPKYE